MDKFTIYWTSDHSVPVYNCTSGAVNPITWGWVESNALPIILRNPFEGIFWYPGGSYKENYYINRLFQVNVKQRWPTILNSLIYFFQLWFHYGPAQLTDLLYRMMGKKPFLVKVSTLMQKSTKALEPFTTNTWTWTHNNMDKLEKEMNSEDIEIFGFNIRKMDWTEYIEAYVQVTTIVKYLNFT